MTAASCALCAVIGALVASPFAAASASPIFAGLGGPPSSKAWTTAAGVSGDGSLVAGNYQLIHHSMEASIWSADGTRISLRQSPPGHSYATGMSVDGTVVIGSINSWQGFRWTESTGMIALRAGGEGEATDVSADGSVIVGWRSDRGYRWTADAGVEFLDAGWPWGVSGDGSTLVGEADGRPVRWEPGAVVPHDLGPLAGGGSQGVALAASHDGSVVVGEVYSSELTAGGAFRWTEERGLVTLGGSTGRSRALDVSADGSIVVGWEWAGADPSAFVWDSAHGMRALRDVLSEMGMDLSGWALWEATAISPDGRHIVGNGRSPADRLEAWVVHLPIEAIPEPSSAWLLGSGLAALLGLRRCAAQRGAQTARQLRSELHREAGPRGIARHGGGR